MKDFDEQYAEIQKSMAPMQEMNSAAVQAFERIVRKNYELMGDLVDFAVAQVQIPQGKSTAQEIFERQSNEAKAFAEKVNLRATEYMELAGELGGMVSSAAESGAASPTPADAEASSKPAAKKAPAASKTTKKTPVKKKSAS